MSFGQRLTELRKENGYSTRNEFAEKLGIPSTTLRNYETDAREPGHTFLKQISEFFNVSVDYLLCLTDEKEILHSFRLLTSEKEMIEKYRNLDDHGKEMVDFVLSKEYERHSVSIPNNPIPSSTRVIQFYQRLASAGSGQFVFDDVPVDLIEIPDIPEYKRVKYAIGVNGDSMEPLYQDGDVLLVEPSREISLGDIGIFLIDGQSYVKQLGENVLISINKKYDPIPITDDTECLGLVISKMPFTPKISLEEAMALEVGRKVLLDIDKAR